ncbi:MAG: amino acid ABC transporter permease [Lachnospiraceae bacterium]|nr:amino acid ABC transporter permease [Lachnospiraceae bacterium]
MRSFHPSYILEVLIQLLPFLWVTVAMVIGTVFFGGAVGILLAAAKVRKGRITRLLANIYIYITRCIPSVIMLFIVYYGLPELLLGFGIDINHVGKGFFVITTFSILFAANMAEVFRSAYEAVDKGQKEAAASIGMTSWQTFYRILLPQCTVVALPNFANALVNLMKEGSLAYTIGLIDIMGKGQLLIGMNHGSYALETYLALTILYWVLTFVVEKSFGVLEKHLSKGKKALSQA